MVRMWKEKVSVRSKEVNRGGKIRTCDPLVPNQVRYQAAPRPDNRNVILNEPALAVNAITECGVQN
jgi:hypothetical protein